MLECLGPLLVALLTQQAAQSQPLPPRPTNTVAAAATAPAHASGFLFRKVTFESQDFPYCVFVPPSYTPQRAWPVILFLHGSGEAGDDGFLQTDVGIGRALRRYHRMIPAIVVMPQAPRQAQWTGTMSRMALRCVEETSRDYHLDPQRVYLTGLSLGGIGAWALAAELPDRFAAVVPICGVGDPDAAGRLKDLPIWAFHGSADDRVPVSGSREVVRALREAGSSKIQYTEIENGGHLIWDQAYADPQLWKWLFSQSRTQPDRP